MIQRIRKELFSMQDLEYKKFHEKLVPNLAQEVIIGVRTPKLREFAKRLFKESGTEEFLSALPHRYYEENNLHAFLIEQMKDYDRCIREVNRFLPYVDNWATCDGMRPKCFQKHTEELLTEIRRWLNDSHCYTVRFAIEMLMVYYLDERFQADYPEYVAGVQREEYYINMMIAWYFATALAKQWDAVLPYLTQNRLSVRVHNKTIQKAVESFRISEEKKSYLKSLKRKS